MPSTPHRQRCFSLLLLALLLALLPMRSWGKRGTASFDSISSFAYVARFVFDPTPQSIQGVSNDEAKQHLVKDRFGFIEFEVDYAEGTKPSLLLYYNGFEGWETVIGEDNGLDCGQRYARATAVVDLTRESEAVKEVSLSKVKWDGRDTVRASGFLYFRSISPQWFFVALANCQPPLLAEDQARCDAQGFCQGPLLASVSFNMTNGSDERTKHFSYDEMGVLELYITAAVLQTLLNVWLLHIRRSLLAVNKYHATVQLLMASGALAWVSNLCNLAYYETYSRHGYADPVGLTIGSFLASASDLLVVYLLILLAKGWTLVRYKISSQGRVKLAVLMTVTFVSTLALETWKARGFDSATVVYFYMTPPGLLVVWLRSLAVVWFVYCCWTTMKSFKSKKRFYTRFALIFTAYLSAKCLMVPICSVALTDNNRFKFMTAFEVTLAFVGHLILCALYQPGVSYNRGFPFHQVGSVMLGLVQGQTASEALREIDASGDDDSTLSRVLETNSGRNDGSNQEADLRSLREAKVRLKESGLNMYRAFMNLGDASEDIIMRLRDLDDYDGEDVDFRKQREGAFGGGDINGEALYSDLDQVDRGGRE
jgi:hypothetical protein